MSDLSPQVEQQEPPLHNEEQTESYRTKALKKRSLFLFPLCYYGFVIAFVSFATLVYAISAFVSSEGEPNIPIEESLTSMTYILLYLDALGFVIAFFLFKSVRTFTLEKMSFEPLKKVSTYLFILLGIGIIFGAQVLVFSVLELETPSNQNQLFGVTPENFSVFKFIAVFVVASLITPVKEELLFRGFILRFFQAKYAKAWLGLLISSAVFGLLHQDYPIAGVTMGLVFGALYLKTNSVMVPIVAHLIWNSYVCLIGLTFLT